LLSLITKLTRSQKHLNITGEIFEPQRISGICGDDFRPIHFPIK
jgi:hypothetical protein